MENNWESIKQKEIEYLEEKLKFFIGELEKIRSNRISLEIIRDLIVNYQGGKKPLKSVANVRISPNYELVVRSFEPKAISSVKKAILDSQLGYNFERDTKDGDCFFTLVPITTQIKDRLIKEAGSIAEEGKVALNLVRQKIRDLVKKNKDFSQDERRNYENQIDKLKKDYEDKLNAAKEKKIKELSS